MQTGWKWRKPDVKQPDKICNFRQKCYFYGHFVVLFSVRWSTSSPNPLINYLKTVQQLWMHRKTISTTKLNEIIKILSIIQFIVMFKIIIVSKKHFKILNSYTLYRCVDFFFLNHALAKYELKPSPLSSVSYAAPLAPLRSIVYQVALQCFLLRAHHCLPSWFLLSAIHSAARLPHGTGTALA